MYNRGVKRDSFGNRNFNNQRMGGGGSGGGRSGNMGGGIGGGMGGGMGGVMGGGNMGGGVNPWESGMMPGRGILPTPNNNLSLASPQAQLAIASNLLSNILRTQQESQPQVPSLLSLGNNYSGPGPNYNNQQSYQQGRYNDRPARQNMKNQRPQPYNKMGNNRARDGATSGRRGPSAQHSRASGNQRINGSQNQHRNDKSSKANAASKNQGAKKEQQGDKSNKASDKTKEKAETSVAESQDEESSENKKRDWNEERKEGDSNIKSEESQHEAKETDAKSDSKEDKENKDDENKDGENKDSEEKKDASGKPPVKKSEARHAESRYADVPMSHMFCHVCNKHMWDGSSFENHLRGRAHKLMMEKLDESYKLKVDLMRHDLRVTEEQRELSLTNSKRRGRKVGIDLNVREYCTMCDLNFYGTLSSHRKSEKHQQLKTFLHPRCTACVKEFPSRIEYDEHCLTPQHMKNAVHNEEQRKGNKKKDKLAKGESDVRTAEDEDKDVGTESKNDKSEETPENVEYVTDIDVTTKENIANLKTPSYKYCRQKQVSIGKSMVKEVQGFYCEKCRRFMLLPEDMASHLRTITHYRNFIQEVKALTTAATAEAEMLKTKEDFEAPNDTTATEPEEYEGNWKRRKIAHSDDEENVDQKKPEASEEQSEEDPKKVVGEEDKYDPMEAENESEEEEAPATEEAKVEEAVEDEEGEQLNDEDPKTKDDKVDWSDGENEFESEVGNLMDDSMDDKEATEQDTSTKSDKTGTPKTAAAAAAAARGRSNQRARGQRARRSRR